MVSVNPLRVRITGTARGELHVSYEDTNGPVGFELSKHQALSLAKVIHKTPPHGLEAFAALLQDGAGVLPEINTEKLGDGNAPIFGQIEAAEDYGTLARPR